MFQKGIRSILDCSIQTSIPLANISNLLNGMMCFDWASDLSVHLNAHERISVEASVNIVQIVVKQTELNSSLLTDDSHESRD